MGGIMFLLKFSNHPFNCYNIFINNPFSKKFSFIVLLFIFANIEISIAGNAGSLSNSETLELVNQPTAGIITNGELIRFRFAGNNNINISGEYFLQKRFVVGYGFNIMNLTGNEKVEISDLLGFIARYRILNEHKYYPAFTLGIDLQGKGEYFALLKHSEFLPTGFYIAASKAFKWDLGYFSLHLGANYPISINKQYDKISSYFGFEQTISKYASVNFEYDFASNSNPKFVLQKGITNVAIRYSISSDFTVGISIIDIFSTYSIPYRMLIMEYRSDFIR